MAEMHKKIALLEKKKTARENKYTRLKQRISSDKNDCKAVKEEIDEIDGEIQRLKFLLFSEILEKNGFTTDDITAAIADGCIKKKAPEADAEENNSVDETTDLLKEDGDINVTESEDSKK